MQGFIMGFFVILSVLYLEYDIYIQYIGWKEMAEEEKERDKDLRIVLIVDIIAKAIIIATILGMTIYIL